ncbi:MAG: hypothetical protein G01um1014106_15 [Parcubacteria group bacterium Gr01-1014_106]|nr:MAG: hypothetical protein G01um1014106_15 [Parcubacteria group bacterium Gr01-1014_106]
MARRDALLRLHRVLIERRAELCRRADRWQRESPHREKTAQGDAGEDLPLDPGLRGLERSCADAVHSR